MSELTARQKFACPSCGGEAQWNAGKQALVCPYCGTVAPMKLDAEGKAVDEHCLVTALRNVPEEQHGWGTEKTSVRCQSCQAISAFDPARVAQRCDFCGSASLVPIEAQVRPIRPESVLEFKL